MLHRLRKAAEASSGPFAGPVECDETHVGGKRKNTQLALALLLRATDRARAVAHYQAFKWEVIARLPQADFTLALSTVRAVSVLCPDRLGSPARATDASDSVHRPRRTWAPSPAGRYRHGNGGTCAPALFGLPSPAASSRHRPRGARFPLRGGPDPPD